MRRREVPDRTIFARAHAYWRARAKAAACRSYRTPAQASESSVYGRTSVLLVTPLENCPSCSLPIPRDESVCAACGSLTHSGIGRMVRAAAVGGRRPATSPRPTPLPGPPPVLLLAVPLEMEEHYGSVDEVLRVLLSASVPGWSWTRDVSPEAISSALASARSRGDLVADGREGFSTGRVRLRGGDRTWGTLVPVRFAKEVDGI